MNKSILIIVISCVSSICYAQLSIGPSLRFGKEKLQPLLTIEYYDNNHSSISAYFNYGQFLSYDYRVDFIRDQYTGAYSFKRRPTLPYEELYDGILVGAETKTQSNGIGLCYKYHFNLDRYYSNQFLLIVDLAYYSLLDNYKITKAHGIDGDIEYSGNFKYSTISCAIRGGYRKDFDKIFLNFDLGINYYYPIYLAEQPVGRGNDYSYLTPFAGVEYEMTIGIGYKLNK